MCWLLFSVLLVLCSALSTAGSTCTLPAALQTSTWEYNRRLGTTLTFGTSTLSGLVFDARGTQLSNFTCISNLNNVFVFRSTFPYSDGGNDRYLFMCMRLTEVTNNLFYFFLLSDIDTTNDVIPNERVLNPPWNNIPPDSNPTCSFCQYTSPPDIIHILHRSGTYDTGIPYDTRPCLPCEAATCNSTAPMIYPTYPMKDPSYPTYPMKDPSYPTYPMKDPSYPTYPMKDPSYPTYPMKDPSYPTYPMKDPSYPTYPMKDPIYPTYPKTYPPNPVTYPPTTSTSIPKTSPNRIMKTSAIHETQCPVRCRNVVGEESIQETKISNMIESGPPLLDMD